jgi:hypothetical protein
MVNKEPGSSGKSLISSSNKFWMTFTLSSSFRSTLGSEPDISDIHPKLENPIRRDNPKKYTFLSMFESV